MMWTQSSNSVTDHIRSFFGFTDGTNQRCIAWAVQDNSSVTSTRRMDLNNQIAKGFSGGNGATAYDIQFKNFTSDGWVHTYINANSTSTHRIYYMAIGGDDITNVKVGTITAPSDPEAAGSTQNVSDVGFVPDMVMLATTAASATPNTHVGGARYSIGFATAQNRQVAYSVSSLTGSAFGGVAGRRMSMNRSVSLLDASSDASTPVLEGEYLGGNSTGNGFNIRWNTIHLNLGMAAPVFYIAIRGGRWDVVTSEFPTSAGAQDITTGQPGIEFSPRGLLFFSTNSGNTIPLSTNAEPRSASATHWRFCLGAATAPNARNVVFTGENNAANPTVTTRSSALDAVLSIRTPDTTGSLSPLLRSADLQSIGGTGITLNHTAVDSANANVKFTTVAVGDAAAMQFVEKELVAKYHIMQFVEKESVHPYSMGGLVMTPLHEHKYHIIGYVEKELLMPAHIMEFIDKELEMPYSISAPVAQILEKELVMPYKIAQFVDSELLAVYNIEEDPTRSSRRYLEGYGVRVYIMSPRMDKIYHVFNSFDDEVSTVGIGRITVDLDAGSAPEAHFEVEDSARILDTAEVGEGNVIAIQAAKSEAKLGDGQHNLFLGYVKHLDGIREDTNNLVYEYTAYGTKIKFNERLTSMNKSAERLLTFSGRTDENSPQDRAKPNPDDPNMKAWRIFLALVNETDHLPFGGPRERNFTTRGITKPESRVDNFISEIKEELTEWSSIADQLAERSTAEWDVTPDNDIFFRYPSLRPSGVIIKDRVDRDNDDPSKTCYIIGPWRWSNSIDKEDGFTNRFAATVGTKSTTSNVVDVAAIADQFETLAVDEPPTDADSGRPLPQGLRIRTGPLIWIRGDLIGANNPTWTMIANLQREFNYNIFYVMLKVGSGTDGPGFPPGNPDWVNPINEMTEARCRLLGYVDTNNGNRTISDMQTEIDRWFDMWGPYGIVFDNVAATSDKFSYYETIAKYARDRGFIRVFANAKRAIPEEAMTQCPSIYAWVIREGAGLPEGSTLKQSWHGKYDDDTRAVLAHSVPSSVTDDDIGKWADETELDDIASWLYVTHDVSPQPYDSLSERIRPMMYALERAAIRTFQNLGYLVPGEPVQQDVGMSFIAQSSKIDDIAIILSKIGDVSAINSGELKHSVYGEILNNRQVLRQKEDPNTGAITTELVDMPEHTNPGSPVAQVRIPLSRIEEKRPTVIFLHGIVTNKAAIVPQRRYWVVLYGRGRDALNTVRWHHAQGDEQLNIDRNYRVAIRVPTASRLSSAIYHTFTSASHPGLSLSYFRNTTHLLEASDPDSIDKFTLVESKIEFPELNDDMMVSKTLQAILNYSARPKRIYDIGSITTPDNLLFPGMTVTIIDEMSGFGEEMPGGATDQGTEAELLSVSYEWDASRDVSCRFLTINAVGHVDFSWQYWFNKFRKGEIDFDTPEIPDIPRSTSPYPQVAGAPIVLAQPRGGVYPTGAAVKFTSNKENVSVLYTRDKSIPADRPSEGDPNTTSSFTYLYMPGESPPVLMNSSGTLRFKGIDRMTGLVSAVYQEEYTIRAPKSTSPSPAPPPGGGTSVPVTPTDKILWVLFRQNASAQLLKDTFSPHLNSQMDGATLFKMKEESISSAHESAVLTSTTLRQDIEFQTLKDLEDNVAGLKNKGYEVVTYNYNPDELSGKEKSDPVDAHKKFAALGKKHGLMIRFNPDLKVCKTYASRLVRYCDFFNIQAHEIQHESENFRNFVKKTASSLRSNNVNIFITVTLSAAHKAQSGQTVLETMKHRWTYAKQHVDGIRITYGSDASITGTVTPFLNWFLNAGRKL